MKKSLALSVSFAAFMALTGCQEYLTRSDSSALIPAMP